MGQTVGASKCSNNSTWKSARLMVRLFHRIEQSGDIPNQWKVAMVVMLPKAWDVKRPIALLHRFTSLF